MNYYVEKRKSLNMSREEASELLNMSPSRLERIEKDPAKTMQPEDVLSMARVYHDPMICNHYCAEDCPLGQAVTPKIKEKEFGQIAIETLNCLNKLSRDKDRLLEIVEDGELTADEQEDFERIMESYDKILMVATTMKLWYETHKAQG